MRNRLTINLSLMGAIAVGLCLGGCATTPAYNPMQIEPGVFFSKVKTVVILPLKLSAKTKNREQIQKNLETFITAKLKGVDIKVVPSKEYDSLWEEMVKKSGGLFDPYTGETDPEKYRSLRKESIRRILVKFKADASVLPDLMYRKASWEGNWAQWDGKKAPVSGVDSFGAAFQLAYMQGTAPALSLMVAVLDAENEIYYGNLGGIQLLSLVQGGKFVDVPEESVLTDVADLMEAVNIALAPLEKAFEELSQTAAPDQE